ncbi:hypothetical protein ABTE37_20355, partial [Acinetobacter baumannii]
LIFFPALLSGPGSIGLHFTTDCDGGLVNEQAPQRRDGWHYDCRGIDFRWNSSGVGAALL